MDCFCRSYDSWNTFALYQFHFHFHFHFGVKKKLKTKNSPILLFSILSCGMCAAHFKYNWYRNNSYCLTPPLLGLLLLIKRVWLKARVNICLVLITEPSSYKGSRNTDLLMIKKLAKYLFLIFVNSKLSFHLYLTLGATTVYY